MMSALLRPILVGLLLAAISLPVTARAACEPLFLDGQVPALLNTRMAQRTTLLCNAAYAALASGVTRGPLWSAEHLTAPALAQARETPREGRFYEDDRLPPDERATLADYARSGYDRGHMAPSGDMPGEEAQQQTFALSNIVPQAPRLNRGSWEGIESAVRKLAEAEGELYVVTGPAFQGQQLQSLKGRVLIPTATWKAVYDPAAGGAGAYLCSNVSRPQCTTMSIAALNQISGIDPFPSLSERVKGTAMPLPQSEPSPYASSRRGSHRRHPQPVP